jgi:hypothetical protein
MVLHPATTTALPFCSIKVLYYYLFIFLKWYRGRFAFNYFLLSELDIVENFKCLHQIVLFWDKKRSHDFYISDLSSFLKTVQLMSEFQNFVYYFIAFKSLTLLFV